MKHIFHDWRRQFLKRPCFNCGLPPKAPWHLVCPSCLEEAYFLSPEGRCPRCLCLLDGQGACRDCAHQTFFWNHCEAFWDYHNEICGPLFIKYKFEASLAAECDLLCLLRPKWEALQGRNILLLPCGADTRRRLGFHPAERLLVQCGLNPELPFTKAKGPAQKDLSAEDRRNRKGLLTLPEGYTPPPDPLLLDDVMTTGRTCSEGARLLKERGATRVDTAVFFRD